MNFREAKKDDLMQVAEIFVNGWKTAYRGIVDDGFLDNLNVEGNYQKRIVDYKKRNHIVAEENGNILGVCIYKTKNDYREYSDVDCELCALYVKPEYKRKGIGSGLVNYVKNILKNEGCSKMIVWCLKENYPSRAFYEKMGGKYCGEDTIQIGGKEYKQVGYTYSLK